MSDRKIMKFPHFVIAKGGFVPNTLILRINVFSPVLESKGTFWNKSSPFFFVNGLSWKQFTKFSNRLFQVSCFFFLFFSRLYFKTNFLLFWIFQVRVISTFVKSNYWSLLIEYKIRLNITWKWRSKLITLFRFEIVPMHLILRYMCLNNVKRKCNITIVFCKEKFSLVY